MFFVYFLLYDSGLSVSGPVVADFHPVYILWLPVSKPALSLYRYPVIELLLVLLHSLVFLELHDLLRNQVIGLRGFGRQLLAQQVVVLRQGQVDLEFLLVLLELIPEDVLAQLVSLLNLLLFTYQKLGVH